MRDYVTEDYRLEVGIKEEQSVYHIINVESEVIEYEDYLLPRTVDTMLEMQQRLSAIRHKFDGAHDNVVQLGEVTGDGTKPIH